MDRIDHLYQDPHEPERRLILHDGNLTDASSLIRVIQQVRPDEIGAMGSEQLEIQFTLLTPIVDT